MKSIVKMLGLKFPGGFDRQLLSKGSSASNTNIFRVEEPSPVSAAAPAPAPAAAGAPEVAEKSPRPERKRSRTISGETVKSPEKRFRLNPGKVSATDRMNLHVSMALELRDSTPGTTLACTMPGCGAQVRSGSHIPSDGLGSG